MHSTTNRSRARHQAIHRKQEAAHYAKQERPYRVSEIYGELTFNILTEKSIPDSVRKEILETKSSGKKVISEQSIGLIANAVKEWAVEKGATHFCHWFQPMTGSTAEKHDAFLTFENGKAIEKLGTNQLMQGEPDASSFPHGGSRSTFEARGYTSWDLSSPLFIMEGLNGKTLCIPTAYVSYTGEALDMKTPLIKSINRVNVEGTKFLKLIGHKDVEEVSVTCGCEQEYFLIDKSFYHLRPDLVMTGRTLAGSLTTRNQQLEDHYFGTIPARVEAFMQDLEYELYRLGIPAKTRHNEVAPGQFEIAPIFEEANISTDHNQVLQVQIKKMAEAHDFVALLHEKPFEGINGSGKHLNWSMADNKGRNLLEPGAMPQDNSRFLAVVSIIMEAVDRHADALRMAIASHGNDHRLGANEAPPSIISIFLGETLDKIIGSMANGENFTPTEIESLDLGPSVLMQLARDNTDRNRTSPFAFTGNKFEFRAVGSSANTSFPLTILNAAVSEVFEESNNLLQEWISEGKSIQDSLTALIKKWAKKSYKIVFNGDGYSSEWPIEAKKRGLPNLRTTADALNVLRDEKAYDFLVKQKVFSQGEIKTRHNICLERYNTYREIEFETQSDLVHQYILPPAFKYKNELLNTIKLSKSIDIEFTPELELVKELSLTLDSLFSYSSNLSSSLKASKGLSEVEYSMKIAHEFVPLSKKVSDLAAKVEDLIPDAYWELPKYYDMLFTR